MNIYNLWVSAWTVCVDLVLERFHVLQPTVEPERGDGHRIPGPCKVVTMANVFDVAAYILKQKGSMTAWKIQKLVYYSQAWSLVWDERPLFPEPIQAWANGPVCPNLYNAHRGLLFIEKQFDAGNPDALDKDGKETIDAVLKYYGDKSAQVLSDLTHSELPWLEARGDIPPGARCTNEITHASMVAFYESLPPDT